MKTVGENFLLRTLEKEDLPLKVRWINDPQVHVHLHYEIPLGLAKTEYWYQDAIADNTRRDFIIETNQSVPVGITGLIGIDYLHRTAEFYVLVGETQYWGKGIGTGAGALLINWAFNWLDLHKIWATADSENVASIKMLKKIGFKEEAILRQERRSAGKWVDVIRVGLLRSEFNFEPFKKIKQIQP
jgi:RimJ/RimL family protein N-acetyltransferase